MLNVKVNLRAMVSTVTTATGVTLGALLGSGPMGLAGTLPSITDFSPAFGQPGDTVVVNGQNLGGASSVTFNGTPALGVSITAPTQLRATVPTGASTGPIVVRTSAGFAVSAANFVVVRAGPYITDFSPTLGAPGDPVMIDGVNFTNVTAVKFNGTNAAFSVTAPTQISASVPTIATAGPITVVTSAGTNTTSSNFVAVGYGPYVTDFSPVNGKPNDTVVINGLNLRNATAVKFNGTNASFQISAATQIHAQVPNGATTGPITVVTPLGTNASANVFVVGNAPLITDFAPTNGVAGTMVVINGANFLGATAVRFNGTNAPSFSVTAATQISVPVPAGATTGPISVVTPNGTNTSATLFAVLQPPVITAVSPVTGPPTTAVLIAGTNLVGATDVLFNGTGAIFTVNSTTNIQVTVPPTATSGPIIVVTPAGIAVSSNAFAVTAPTTPTITGVSPAGGPPGTAVTITGTQFINVFSVKFNGGPVPASATTVSPTEIDAIVPLGATTGPITVMTQAGTASSTNAFVVGPAPIIGSFSPTNGPAGTIVQIAGAGFLGASAVQFNGVPALFQVNSPTQMAAQVPSTARTGAITITTPTGTVVSTDDFVVVRIANLPLRQTASTGQANLGITLTNTFTIVNNGPSDATGVMFADTLPSGVTFISATSTLGAVSRTNNLVACSLGGLPVGGGATITIVTLPTVVGSITNTGKLTANEADTNPSERIAQTVVRVLPPVLTLRPVTAQSVEIGWPAVAAGFKLQVAPQLVSTAWTDATNAPALIGSRYLVTNVISVGVGFYRLRQAP